MTTAVKTKRILILCTGNSCRSQMAEGLLKSFDKNLEVYSAGTKPAEKVNPFAVKAMQEIGIDISNGIAENVDKYLSQSFDYVITVCDNAKESCPVFIGNVKHRLHIGIDDPADAVGSEEEVMPVYRRVRDEIKKDFYEFYKTNLKDK
jgi:arsenate reductase (thioredoxin)